MESQQHEIYRASWHANVEGKNATSLASRRRVNGIQWLLREVESVFSRDEPSDRLYNTR